MTHALIIDDDRSNLEVMGQILELSEIEYTPIQNPTDVSGVLDNQTVFDLIVVDLEMPELSGYDLLKLFRTQAHLSDVPVVACTVHTNEMTLARDKGFHSFITKPLDIDLFPRQVQQILAGEHIWQTV